jgi:Asp-tRNA(Asn)/Glu-tRNA(Gln) amidotransferase A subunit family amidase
VYNAIVNLAPDDVLLRQADERDAELARGESRTFSGLLLIGRPKGDAALLQAAAAYEIAPADMLGRRPEAGLA